MFRKLVSIYKSYLIHGSARLPQDGNLREPSISVLLLTYIMIFVYYNIMRHLYPSLRALIYSQLYITDIVEYFGDRIPIHQLRLYIQAELIITVNNIIDLKEYRFHTIITGYYPHASAKDDIKRKQESRELYFIALL